MFRIRPSSKIAAQCTKPVIAGKGPLSERVRGPFPFKRLQVGQSFFMRYDEATPHEFWQVKEQIRRYNKQYAVFFYAIKHKDEPKRLEIARLV